MAAVHIVVIDCVRSVSTISILIPMLLLLLVAFVVWYCDSWVVAWGALMAQKTDPIHIVELRSGERICATLPMTVTSLRYGHMRQLVLHYHAIVHATAQIRILTLRPIRLVLVVHGMHGMRRLELWYFITAVKLVMMLLLLITLVSYHAMITHKRLGILMTHESATRGRQMHMLFLFSKGHTLCILRPVAEVLLPAPRVNHGLGVVRLLLKVAIASAATGSILLLREFDSLDSGLFQIGLVLCTASLMRMVHIRQLFE